MFANSKLRLKFEGTRTAVVEVEVEKGGRGSLGNFGLSTAFRTERVGADPHSSGQDFPGLRYFSLASREHPRCVGGALRT